MLLLNKGKQWYYHQVPTRNIIKGISKDTNLTVFYVEKQSPLRQVGKQLFGIEMSKETDVDR